MHSKLNDSIASATRPSTSEGKKASLIVMHKKVLLTSVGRPLGPKRGDAPSIGYGLLERQVTRAQALFSPRARAEAEGLGRRVRDQRISLTLS